jgi:hypothetical protein
MTPGCLASCGNRVMSFERAGEAPARRERSPYVQANCRHDDFHAIRSRYDRRLGVLAFLLVCEHCGAEVRELWREAYWPHYDRNGNGRYLAQRAGASQHPAQSRDLDTWIYRGSAE